jgi:8-oxo-dGTP pyrophosphatase MutT (NUDIX family)
VRITSTARIAGNQVLSTSPSQLDLVGRSSSTTAPPATGYHTRHGSEVLTALHDLRGALERRPTREATTPATAAVAAVLGADLELLLIRRAEHERDPWSGHVSFPGGRVDPGDRGPLEAAMRETLEEVGLALAPELSVGALDDLTAVGGRPGLVVRPYVFVLPVPIPTLVPNGEVAATLTVPLETLLADTHRSTMTWQRDGVTATLPAVQLGPHRLWGMTLRMVDDLLDRIDGRGTGLRRIRT